MTVDNQARPGSRRGATLNWALTITMNIALPLATYFVLTGAGVGAVPALLAGGAWPAIETLVSLAVYRKIDEFSVFVLIFLVLSVLAAVGFTSPRLLLVKEAAVNGLFGVVLLASLALPRPLMFYFGRRFATDGSAASAAWWNGLWRFPGFRLTQRVITIVWGVVTVLAALLQIALSYQLSTDAMAVISNLAPFVVYGILVAWTVRYGRARARLARQRSGDAALPPEQPAEPPESQKSQESQESQEPAESGEAVRPAPAQAGAEG